MWIGSFFLSVRHPYSNRRGVHRLRLERDIGAEILVLVVLGALRGRLADGLQEAVHLGDKLILVPKQQRRVAEEEEERNQEEQEDGYPCKYVWCVCPLPTVFGEHFLAKVISPSLGFNAIDSRCHDCIVLSRHFLSFFVLHVLQSTETVSYVFVKN